MEMWQDLVLAATVTYSLENFAQNAFNFFKLYFNLFNLVSKILVQNRVLSVHINKLHESLLTLFQEHAPSWLSLREPWLQSLSLLSGPPVTERDQFSNSPQHFSSSQLDRWGSWTQGATGLCHLFCAWYCFAFYVFPLSSQHKIEPFSLLLVISGMIPYDFQIKFMIIIQI